MFVRTRLEYWDGFFKKNRRDSISPENESFDCECGSDNQRSERIKQIVDKFV